MIQFEHVSKSYGKTPVLKDLNFTIPDGQFVVLIGPSGCGKTTTMKMINRLLEPDSGTIRIDGQDIHSQDKVELRRHIGYVIQQIGLFPNMTVAQNICVVPKLLKYDKARCDEIVQEMLQLVHMEQSANKYPSELSGGQQQRIGVLFIWWGNIYPTVIVALSVYAMFPVLKNTYTGILEVEPKYIEAAKGCGMSSFQTLVRVELPLAMPVIISGLRMAAIYTVSWAVLASMIGLGGLGDFVYRGTSSNNNTLILLGAIPAAILAVLFGLVIDLLQKRVTPRGLRKEAGK